MPTATFDGDTLRVVLPSVGTYDATEDIYSDWKVWFKTGDNSKYPLAFDTTGGDPTTATQSISPFYFLRNDLGWRISPPEADGEVIIEGDLFRRDPDLPLYVPTVGAYSIAVIQVVSSKSLITEGTGGTGTTSLISHGKYGFSGLY